MMNCLTEYDAFCKRNIKKSVLNGYLIQFQKGIPLHSSPDSMYLIRHIRRHSRSYATFPKGKAYLIFTFEPHWGVLMKVKLLDDKKALIYLKA